MNIIIVQRVIPSYRLDFFNKLIKKNQGINVSIFSGNKDIPEQRALSADSLELPPNFKIFNSKFLKIFNVRYPFFQGMLQSLKDHKPDVVICEGESNFINNFIIIFYKIFFDPRCKLIHWSIGVMPGYKPNFFKIVIKKFLQSFFNGNIFYSSYGKKLFSKYIRSSKNSIVLVNIPNIDQTSQRFLNFNKDHNVEVNKKIILIYVGSFEPDKNNDSLIAAAVECKDICEAFFIGQGSQQPFFKDKYKDYDNLHFLGKLDQLSQDYYYQKANLFILPGRGGMVISESIARGVPVLLFQADGVEYDLVPKNDYPELYLSSDNKEEIINKIKFFHSNKKYLTNAGAALQSRLVENFSLNHNVDKFMAFIESQISNNENNID